MRFFPLEQETLSTPYREQYLLLKPASTPGPGDSGPFNSLQKTVLVATSAYPEANAVIVRFQPLTGNDVYCYVNAVAEKADTSHFQPPTRRTMFVVATGKADFGGLRDFQPPTEDNVCCHTALPDVCREAEKLLTPYEEQCLLPL